MPGEPLAIDPGQVAEQAGRLEGRDPAEILSWVFGNIPGTVVATSFQPGGIVVLDLLGKLGLRPPVIFVDTLWHFPETLELAERARERFDLDLRIYRPDGLESEAEFVSRHGDSLWDRDLELYQEVTKVEPMRRALRETAATTWVSARRRDQGGERTSLPVLEIAGGRIKANPLAGWTRKEVWAWILSNGLPYNPLHDQGYPSIGDRPLTEPVQVGGDERSGRWKGRGKTECGIHTSL